MSGNENIFDTEASLSNKTTLSAAIMIAPKGVVVIEANEEIVKAFWTSEQPPFMVEPPRIKQILQQWFRKELMLPLIH